MPRVTSENLDSYFHHDVLRRVSDLYPTRGERIRDLGIGAPCWNAFFECAPLLLEKGFSPAFIEKFSYHTVEIEKLPVLLAIWEPLASLGFRPTDLEGIRIIFEFNRYVEVADDAAFWKSKG